MDLNLGRIGQVATSAKDIEASIKFYTEVLGLRLTMRPQPGMAFFECAGQNLLIEQQRREQPHGSDTVLYFDVHDLAVSLHELEARGVKFKLAPHRIAQLPTYDLWMAFFEDPDKHLLALQMRAPKGYEYPKN